MPGFLESKWVELLIAPMVTGVLASLVFLLIASRFRPAFRISTQIARMPASAFCHDGPGVCTGYAVKVLNTSRTSAIEIKAKMSIVSLSHVQGGFIGASKEFTVTKPELFELPGKRKDAEDSAFRFVTHEPIEQNWDQDHYVVFTLFAKHALTGFGKVFTQRYDLCANSVKDGEFARGDSMDIFLNAARVAAKP